MEWRSRASGYAEGMVGTATRAIHLTAGDHFVIGPEQFGSPGLWARESVGPFAAVEALGTLVTVHDSRFAPGRGIRHHPHRGMERLFYILEGAVDHDDALNHITGHMATGDLGVLTEGERGMVHSEWNHGDADARAYILVYPAEPLPPDASFAAVRDGDARREHPSDGVEVKHIVERSRLGPLHGDLRHLADVSLAPGAVAEAALGEDEAGVVFAVEGEVEVGDSAIGTRVLRAEETLLLPPIDEPRALWLSAERASRVLYALTGPGFGLRQQSVEA